MSGTTRAPDCPAGRVVHGDRPCEGPATYYCDELICGPIFDRRKRGEETPAERVARQFHEAYERLAPEFGYGTRLASRVRWDRVPERNRRLMIAVAQELLDSAESDALDGQQLSGTPDTTTPAVTEEDRAKAAAPVLIARCGNDLWELSRGAAPVMTRCAGLLRFRWGMTQAACDTCGAWCGVAVANWEAVENAAERGKADALRAAMHALAEEWKRRNFDSGDPYTVGIMVGKDLAAERLRAIADGQR